MGRLFGSVTNVDIVDALQGLGHTVEKAMVRMPDGPLKHVGEFPLTIALHHDAPRAHHRDGTGRYDRNPGSAERPIARCTRSGAGNGPIVFGGRVIPAAHSRHYRRKGGATA